MLLVLRSLLTILIPLTERGPGHNSNLSISICNFLFTFIAGRVSNCQLSEGSGSEINSNGKARLQLSVECDESKQNVRGTNKF